MITPSAPLVVRVPGSTSNLGPGYDVLGLAVDRYLEARWYPGVDPLRTVGRGALEGLDPSTDLVRRALATALATEPASLGGRLELDSDIPVARGLGSSAAARVAGEVLAVAVRRAGDALGGPRSDSGSPGPVPVTEEERRAVVARASRGEGHPDNVVPSVVGGFVAAALDEHGVRWTPLPLSPAVGMAYAAPAVEVRTAEARQVLPATVPHADAAGNGARLATLLAGLATADGDRIAWGLGDRLHVPWRWRLVPGADEAAAAAAAAGAWGVTLSGSGSGLLAFVPPTRAAEVADAMDRVFAGVPGPGRRWAFPLRRSPTGATAVRPEVSVAR